VPGPSPGHGFPVERVDRLVECQGLWRDPLRNQVRAVEAEFNVGRLISTNAKDRHGHRVQGCGRGPGAAQCRLPDVEQKLAAFDDEKNAGIRNRLDFVRRRWRPRDAYCVW
jgi:hypothetical protein